LKSINLYKININITYLLKKENFMFKLNLLKYFYFVNIYNKQYNKINYLNDFFIKFLIKKNKYSNKNKYKIINPLNKILNIFMVDGNKLKIYVQLLNSFLKIYKLININNYNNIFINYHYYKEFLFNYNLNKNFNNIILILN
jgi:hypothetical protein